MSARVYRPLDGRFQFKEIEHGILIRYPIHPYHYWALRMTEQEFKDEHWQILDQMQLNHTGETFRLLDEIAEISQGETFGAPICIGSPYPEEPRLPPCKDQPEPQPHVT